MTADDEQGYTPTVAPGGDQLRAALRSALAQFIDPDDDTMPYCNRVDGGYTWTPADGVIDRLVRAVHRPVGVVAAAEAGVEPDCAVCGPNTWPCATVSTVYEEQP